MAKGLPFLLLRNSAILKPKNQNEDIWNSNGDVPTVGNTNSVLQHISGDVAQKSGVSV